MTDRKDGPSFEDMESKCKMCGGLLSVWEVLNRDGICDPMLNKCLSFAEANERNPQLVQELITLEYILTWRCTDNIDRDHARYIEVQKLLYAHERQPL